MMTNDSSRAVRWLVIIALSVATAGMFLISMRANYLYGRSIGQSAETQETFAWANVGADVWKGFGLIVVVALWRSGWRRAAFTTGLTWFVCLLFSVSSAIGIYVQERTSLTGSREAKHASYEDAQKELADVESKRKGLARHRSVGEVEAAIAGVLARPVVIGERVRGTVAALSANCTKDDKRTAEACAEVAELREELAVANESAKLEQRATALRTSDREVARHGRLPRPRSGRTVLGMAHARMDHRARGRFRSSLVLCIDDRDRFSVRSARDCRVRRSDTATIDGRHDAPCRGWSRCVALRRGRSR